MGFQDFLAIMIVGAATLYVTRTLWRTLSGRGGCNCSHSSAATKSDSESTAQSMGMKRTPFIPLEQLGLPQRDKIAAKSNSK